MGATGAIVCEIAGGWYSGREFRLYSNVDFIEMTATSFLRQAFRADLVGIWHVDLAGPGSYCLADSPSPPEAFHDHVLGHPLVAELRKSGELAPVQAEVPPEGYCLAIPLAMDDSHARLVAVSRASQGFSPHELTLASHLQPVLAGVWAMQPRAARDDG